MSDDMRETKPTLLPYNRRLHGESVLSDPEQEDREGDVGAFVGFCEVGLGVEGVLSALCHNRELGMQDLQHTRRNRDANCVVSNMLQVAVQNLRREADI